MIKSAKAQKHFQKRLTSEKRFKAACSMAANFGLILLVALVGYLFYKGYSAFLQTEIRLTIKEKHASSQEDLYQALGDQFPMITYPESKRLMRKIVSFGAHYRLKDKTHQQFPYDIWIPASSNFDLFHKGKTTVKTTQLDRLQIFFYRTLHSEHRIRTRFNWTFLSAGDSREPELAGVLGALMGSLFLLIVTVAIAFPLGVLTALYLEEFAPKNFWTHLIEVNVKNLAAVPSILFGLLGLAIFIQYFGAPRSASFVGGLILSLLILPITIVAAQASIKTLPHSIREAALGLGASHNQMVFHHVLPAAMPGIITGMILGISRAIGETAPLLMIGMVAFIADVPKSFSDPATALPVQIYIWATSPEAGYVEKASAAILILVLLLVSINLFTLLFRGRFEKGR